MSPSSPAGLHKNDRLYLRIHYQTNVQMWIRPVYSSGGARIKKGLTSGQWLLDPGEGDALAWVTFREAASIDSIHVSASASGRDGFASQDVAVDFRWDAQPSSGETQAPWVGPLLAAERAHQQQEFADMERRLGSGSGGIGAVSIGLGLVMVVVAGVALFAGFAWPVWGIVRWRGGWRIAAAVPAAALGFWTIKDVFDIVSDRTSHNLLPFEFIIGGFLILPYMLVVTIVRRVRLKGRTNG